MSVKISVSDRVYVFGLNQEQTFAVQKRFLYDNPQYAKIRAMGYRTKERPTIVTADVQAGHVSIPRGGFHRLRSLLRELNLEFEWLDQRTLGDAEAKKIPDTNVQLYPYQERVLESVIKAENCLMRLPTGSGKSTIALAMASRLKLPTLVVVWSSNLFTQWEQRAMKELGLGRHELGRIQGGTFQIRPLTIAMQQTLASRGVDATTKNYFGLVIADEVQRFAARTLFDVIDPFPAKYRLGVSADETRKDGKEFLVYDLFGRVAAEVPRDELIKSGHVHDVSILVAPTKFRADWFRVNQDFNKLLEHIALDQERNDLVIELAMRELESGEQVVVLSHRREHCFELAQLFEQKGMNCGFMIGGAEHASLFEQTRMALMDGSLRVAVGTLQAIGQGMDIPKLGVAIVATPAANNRQQFGQIRGRVCRTAEGKVGAKLIYLWDQFVYGKKTLTNLCSWNNQVLVSDGRGSCSVKEYLIRLNAK